MLYLSESGKRSLRVYQKSNMFEKLLKHYGHSVWVILNFVEQELSVNDLNHILNERKRFKEEESKKHMEALRTAIGFGIIAEKDGMYVDGEYMEDVYKFYGLYDEYEY